MTQRLIVEGNDGWAITQLCKSNGLPNPIGFTDKTIGKFVKSAGGYDKVADLIDAALLEAQVTNIGIVVDANDVGPAARWEAIRHLLRTKFSEDTLNAATLDSGGILLQEESKPVVGVWIMPDNLNNGYLEHFLAELADRADDLWKHAESSIETLIAQHFCRFDPETRRQKALLHTWLAWQKEPGRPFGIAMQAGYLNPIAPAASLFLDWMKRTFQLDTESQ